MESETPDGKASLRSAHEKPCVWIFKEEKVHDPYRQLFEEHHFTVKFHPLLSFQYIHVEDLRHILQFEAEEFQGVVITSANAFKAMEYALTEHIDVKPLTSWKLYVISHITEAKAPVPFSKSIVANGYAWNLVQLIREDLATCNDTRPLLFLSGNLRRDELPLALQTSSIPYRELKVYETLSEIDHVKEEQLALALEIDRPNWLLFYSPSGVRTFFESFPDSKRNPHIWNEIQIASIGTTTADELVKWFPTSVTASSPTPLSMLEVVLKHHLTSDSPPTL